MHRVILPNRKWSRKEDLAKNNFVLELFTKDITMFDTGANTVELLNIVGCCLGSEYARVHEMTKRGWRWSKLQ